MKKNIVGLCNTFCCVSTKTKSLVEKKEKSNKGNVAFSNQMRDITRQGEGQKIKTCKIKLKEISFFYKTVLCDEECKSNTFSHSFYSVKII